MNSDLDGSLGSQYFLNVTNERICFATYFAHFVNPGFFTLFQSILHSIFLTEAHTYNYEY